MRCSVFAVSTKTHIDSHYGICNFCFFFKFQYLPVVVVELVAVLVVAVLVVAVPVVVAAVVGLAVAVVVVDWPAFVETVERLCSFDSEKKNKEIFIEIPNGN